MAKLNKELQENLKEINNIIFKMAEIENDFIISTNIHSEMIEMRALRKANASMMRSTCGSSQTSPSICRREAIFGYLEANSFDNRRR